MSEVDLLKKKFSELVEAVKAFVVSHCNLSRYLNLKSFSLNTQTLVILVGISVVIGSLVSFFMMTKAPWKLMQGASFMPESKSFFPGRQPDGSFVFSNFESPEEIHGWKLINAQMVPSTHYAWEGLSSAQISFPVAKELSAVTLEELGRVRDQPSDWSSYGALEFYLFQPGNAKQTLMFLVTDLQGKQYEETLDVPANEWKKFSFPVSQVAKKIDLKKVNQVSLSSRSLEEATDFYLDDVRLVSSSGGELPSSAYRGMDYGFSKRKAAWIFQDTLKKMETVRVPFIVKNETAAFCHLCPTEGGVPFPVGEIKSLNALTMHNLYNEEIPFQARVLAYWPDHSIKWLGLSFQSTLRPGEGAGYFLDYGPGVQAMEIASPLKVTEEDDVLRINTGTLEVVLNKKTFLLFDQVLLDQNEISSKALLTLNFKGKEYRTDLDSQSYELRIEEKGPQRVVVRASAWFVSAEGERFSQAIVRYTFYAGKSYVKLSHTLIYTGYPDNRQFAPNKLLKLPENEMIESFGIKVPYPFSTAEDEQIFLGRERNVPLGIKPGETFSLFQKDYDSVLLTRDGESLANEERISGWLDVSSENRGITVAVRHLSENYPKAIKLNRAKKEVQIDLWPEEAGPLDLSTTSKAVGPDDYGRGNAFGLAKTHDLLLYFHPKNFAESNAFHVATGFMEPLILRNNPFWIDATGALGRLYPSDPKYATAERMLDRLFDWAERHPRQFKWYGMLDFGDVLTWWRSEDEDQKYPEAGWNPVGRWGWYNCEGVGLHTGALLQFARTGLWKYFRFGENSALHLMDVDTIHYDTIKADKRIKGLLPDRYSHVGSMHRHSGDHWSGRTDEASHTSVVGILLYYYLTGNERALEVAKEIGEYFLKEPFTYIGRPDMVPNRAMANALWGDVLLYQATWDERYKRAAEKIIKIFLKGQQPDGSFLENYNPLLGMWSGEKHQLYMTGYLVGALISYHELTQDEAVKEMFLKLIRYLVPQEYSGPAILHGIAYAYLITHDPFFIAAAEQNLKELFEQQQFSPDPMIDGLIYEKPIYHRPMTFLSTVPYVFGALEEHFSEQQKGKP